MGAGLSARLARVGTRGRPGKGSGETSDLRGRESFGQSEPLQSGFRESRLIKRLPASSVRQYLKRGGVREALRLRGKPSREMGGRAPPNECEREAPSAQEAAAWAPGSAASTLKSRPLGPHPGHQRITRSFSFSSLRMTLTSK